MERKDFLQKFAIGGSLLLTTPILFNSCSDDEDLIGDTDPGENGDEVTVDLSHEDFSNLGTVGGFAYSGDIIIIRSSESNYIALSKICTHQGCTVSYNHDESQLPCPCHGSVYNTSGGVVNGPAEESLVKYNVTKEGDILTIS